MHLKAFGDKIKTETDKIGALRYHQYVVVKYLVDHPTQRGLLVYHGMGTGKTILAVNIALEYKKRTNHKIIIIASKNLQKNFQEAFQQHKYSENLIDAKAFISAQSGNLYEQVIRASIDYSKRLGSNVFIKNGRSLENSIIIFDEAHNFFNSICHGGKNAVHLYDRIMKTRNIKLIFLTGSPIVNTPFELVPCFNMLHGTNLGDNKSATSAMSTFSSAAKRSKSKHKFQSSNPRNESRLFSEYKDDFDNFFINKNSTETPAAIGTIKNKSYFQNRIVGLVSYYNAATMKDVSASYMYKITNQESESDFPKQFDLRVEIVPMSPQQFEQYELAREKERKEFSFGSTAAKRFGSTEASSSTYRIRSRILSNFLFPKHAIVKVTIPAAEQKSNDDSRTSGTASLKKKSFKLEKRLNLIKAEDFNDLQRYSPKIMRLLELIEQHPFPQLIYSEFVANEGIGVISRLLEHNGYTNWASLQLHAEEREIESDLAGEIQQNRTLAIRHMRDSANRIFAVISGQIAIEERIKIVEEFNDYSNMHGKMIAILLISKTGAEGLDCKHLRTVHIMEPFWNYARIEQIIARAVRYKSHSDMPEQERNVQPIIYLSTFPEAWEGPEKMLQYGAKRKEKLFVLPESADESDALVKTLRSLPKSVLDNAPNSPDEFTTDVELFKSAIQNKLLINDFLLCLKEASCDCFAHNSDTSCRMCAPNNRALFSDSISRDLSLPDPCKPAVEDDIVVEEIVLSNGQKLYFSEKSKGEFELYMYNASLDAYVPVKRNHPQYAQMYRAVMRG